MEESTKMTQFEEHREKKIEEKWWVPGILETILNCLTNITEVAEGEETENGVEKIFEKIYVKETMSEYFQIWWKSLTHRSQSNCWKPKIKTTLQTTRWNVNYIKNNDFNS